MESGSTLLHHPRQSRQLGQRRAFVGTLLCVTSSHALVHMFTALMSLIYPIVAEQFGFSYMVLGSLLTVARLVGSVSQAFWGNVSRKSVRGYLLGAGTIVLSVGMGLVSTTKSFLQFATCVVLSRIGAGPHHPVGNAAIAEIAGNSRGFGFGLNVGFANVGGLIAPLIGAFLLLRVGWRLTLLLMAIPGVVIGTLTIMFMPRPTGRDEPSPQHSMAPLDVLRELVLTAKEVLAHRSTAFVFCAAAIAAAGSGLGIVTTFIPMYFHDVLGIRGMGLGVMVSLLQAGSVIGPVFAGLLSDRCGRFDTTVGTFLVSAACTLCLLSARRMSGLLVFYTVLVGLSAYSQSPLMTGVYSEAMQGNPDAGLGLFFSIIQLAGSLWGFVLGTLITFLGFRMAIGFLGTVYVAAAGLVWMAGRSGRAEARPQ